MARTEKFQRLENWRLATGRNSKTGDKRRKRSGYKPTTVPMPIIKRAVDEIVIEHGDLMLVILALRMAAANGRQDLRPHYERLADALLNGTYGRRFEHGDGI